MSLRQAAFSGTLPGRSLKTARMPWFASSPTMIAHTWVNFSQPAFPATAHTKGAWTQIVSSTPSDTGLIVVNYNGTSGIATDASVLFDIGVGASGSEVVVASNIAVGGGAFSQTPHLSLPIFIPSGSRIAARAQAATTATAGSVTWLLFRAADAHLTPRSVDTLGVVSSTSRGIALSGASGSYTEIVASTSQPYQAQQLIASAGGKTGINGTFRLTLAVGAAGSEVDIGTIDLNQGSGGQITLLGNPSPQPAIFGRTIPAGSRLSVKHNISANPERIQAQVIGIPFR
jgi:hypothetical protein